MAWGRRMSRYLWVPAQEIARRKPVHARYTQLMCALLAEVQAQDFARYAFWALLQGAAFLGAIAKHCSAGDALLFCARNAGQRMTPTAALAKMPQPMAGRMKAVCTQWEAEKVYIPKFNQAVIFARNRAMVREEEGGDKIKSIAQRWGVKKRAVYKVIKEHEKI